MDKKQISQIQNIIELCFKGKNMYCHNKNCKIYNQPQPVVSYGKSKKYPCIECLKTCKNKGDKHG
jgi:hypothetical protein